MWFVKNISKKIYNVRERKTKKSKFEKVKCNNCGKTHRSSKNIISKEKRNNTLV